MREVVVQVSGIKYAATVKKWYTPSGLTEIEAGFKTKKDAEVWMRATHGPKWKTRYEVLKVVATKMVVVLDTTGGESST